MGRGEKGRIVKVLVTGGLGFVGHAVCWLLAKGGHDVVALSSRPGSRSVAAGVDTVHADLRDRDAVRRVVNEVRPEGVCHLAALTRVRDSFDRPVAYFDVNVGGTSALLDALTAGPPVPLVFMSTGAVYGHCDGQVTEDQPRRPTNPYASSKAAAEDVVAYQAATGAIGAVTLRCFNVAGGWRGVGDEDPTRIIPNAVRAAVGVRDVLELNGDGSAVREFTHVIDVADAVVAALVEAATPGEARVYNVGGGIETPMRKVINTVEAVTGRTVPVVHRPPKAEPAVVIADSTRIRSELGWKPLHSGLAEIVRDAWAIVYQSVEMKR